MKFKISVVARDMLKVVLATILFVAILFFSVNYIFSFIISHWDDQWKYRTGTTDINEAKQRGVFVKELNYEIDSFPDTLSNFKPYIEKGFKYKRHSYKETVPLTETGFPYQLSFNYKPNQNLTIFIRKSELNKFDSSNSSWGYLKKPDFLTRLYWILEVKILNQD